MEKLSTLEKLITKGDSFFKKGKLEKAIKYEYRPTSKILQMEKEVEIIN